MAYTLILSELKELDPIIPNAYSEPYEVGDAMKRKVEKLLRQLAREKALKDRIAVLTYYFYLGKLLEEDPKAKKYLTNYQRKIARRTYYIFEPLTHWQIGRTKALQPRHLHQMTNQQYLEARQEAIRIRTELENENILLTNP